MYYWDTKRNLGLFLKIVKPFQDDEETLAGYLMAHSCGISESAVLRKIKTTFCFDTKVDHLAIYG